MKKTIRITESELKNMVKETVMSVLNENIDEFNDWRAQMLHNGTYKAGDETYTNQKGVEKANQIAKAQYGADAAGVENYNTLGNSNTLNLEPERGSMSSSEKDLYSGVIDSKFNIHSPRIADGGGMEYTTNGFQTQGDKYLNNMKTDKAKDFQQRAGNDMIDYYSGNYRDRLKQKASQLGNANSGQNFTPKVLREAVSRVIRRYLR